MVDIYAETVADRDWFRYSELSPEAKARARNWWRGQSERDQTYGLSELLESDLRDHFGVTDCKLFYSLNCCQGDGVAFYGRPCLDEWAKKDKQLSALMAAFSLCCGLVDGEVELVCEIDNVSWHSHHWNTMSVLVSDHFRDDDPLVGHPVFSATRNIEEYLDERVKDISRELEKIGYSEIDYQKSDEYINENILAGDEWCRWDEDGCHV